MMGCWLLLLRLQRLHVGWLLCALLGDQLGLAESGALGARLRATIGRDGAVCGRRLSCTWVLLSLSLLLLNSLLQVHLHVSLLLVAASKFPVASITTERFLARMGPLVGGQVVAAAERARALLWVTR